MDNSASSSMYLISFDQIYDTNIKPKLEAIDIFLKSTVAPYDIDQVALLFKTSRSKILDVMKKLGLTSLDRLSFFELICHLPIDICLFIKRQCRYVDQVQYTPEMIAYIYMLNVNKVKKAFEELEIKFVYEHELVEVFKKIHISIFYL